MQTALDCLHCFLKQALYTVRLTNASPKKQKKIIDRVALLLPTLDMTITPPENSIAIYNLIAKLSGVADPFAALKKESNKLALSLRPGLRKQINASPDPLFAAIKFAIAGNIIDYGSHQEFDVRKTLADCLADELAVNDYDRFTRDLEQSKNILYLGDNCGELVFDGLLLEQIDKKVTLAVKELPIINDALVDDALECGLDKHAEVISNGTGYPGTPLEQCSPVFRKKFNEADLIISKGQGNFETLMDVHAPIYFLLTVKCPIIAHQLGGYARQDGRRISTGDTIFIKSKNAA